MPAIEPVEIGFDKLSLRKSYLQILPVAAISNHVYSGAIGNRGYEFVKVFWSVLNYAEKAEGSTRA